MYEFHGWVWLGENPNNSLRNNTHDFNDKIIWLKSILPKHQYSNYEIELLEHGENYKLSLHSCKNRRLSEADEMLALVKSVANKFSDAKGLIFEYDEQTRMVGGFGVYTVIVIDCGRVSRRQDPFLSPAEEHAKMLPFTVVPD